MDYAKLSELRDLLQALPNSDAFPSASELTRFRSLSTQLGAATIAREFQHIPPGLQRLRVAAFLPVEIHGPLLSTDVFVLSSTSPSRGRASTRTRSSKTIIPSSAEDAAVLGALLAAWPLSPALNNLRARYAAILQAHPGPASLANRLIESIRTLRGACSQIIEAVDTLFRTSTAPSAQRNGARGLQNLSQSGQLLATSAELAGNKEIKTGYKHGCDSFGKVTKDQNIHSVTIDQEDLTTAHEAVDPLWASARSAAARVDELQRRARKYGLTASVVDAVASVEEARALLKRLQGYGLELAELGKAPGAATRRETTARRRRLPSAEDSWRFDDPDDFDDDDDDEWEEAVDVGNEELDENNDREVNDDIERTEESTRIQQLGERQSSTIQNSTSKSSTDAASSLNLKTANIEGGGDETSGDKGEGTDWMSVFRGDAAKKMNEKLLQELSSAVVGERADVLRQSTGSALASDSLLQQDKVQTGLALRTVPRAKQKQKQKLKAKSNAGTARDRVAKRLGIRKEPKKAPR